MIYVWFVVILVTALVVIPGSAWLLGRAQARYDRVMLLDRLDEAVAMPQLPRAGRFEVEYLPGPPFAGASDRGYELMDTGPLLILSEHNAAKEDLLRSTRRAISETDWLIKAGEDKIPSRWR